MSIPALRSWLETPQGAYVLGWEQRRFDLALTDVFGFNAVQIGLLDHDLLRTNRMPFKFRCDEPGAGGQCDVLTDLRHLPFAANSIDLVVLPHVLEFSADPHQVLREVERVLVPEGHVLVSGFNPYSMWGVRRGVHRVAGRCEPVFPWVGSYLSMRRIKDWLKLLGFEPHAGWFGCYTPPVATERWLRRWRFLESAGSRWWPFLGGVYVVQAIKRVHGMRLITPKWSERAARAKALTPVVQKHATHKHATHKREVDIV